MGGPEELAGEEGLGRGVVGAEEVRPAGGGREGEVEALQGPSELQGAPSPHRLEGVVGPLLGLLGEGLPQEAQGSIAAQDLQGFGWTPRDGSRRCQQERASGGGGRISRAFQGMSARRHQARGRG